MITLDSVTKLGTIAADKIRDNQDFFVTTRRSRYIYRRSIGSDTADGNRRVAPASGGGLFYKDLDYAHPSWVREQLQYYVDEANSTGLANDDNTGADATHPLLTDVERVDRWGANPRLDAGKYEVWCLSDVTKMILHGTRGNGAQVWIHGSGTAFQGRSTLAGSNTMSQRAVAVPSTYTRPSLRGGSAGSFLTTIANPNRRLRLTSGARAGATSFAQSIQGSDVNVSQWTQLSTWDPLTFRIPDICDPAGTETYVVESLGTIGTCYSDMTTTDSVSSNSTGVTFDSINVGKFGCVDSTAFPVFIGCTGVSPISPDENFFIQASVGMFGSFTIASLISANINVNVFSCHNIGAWGGGPATTIVFGYNTITEGTPMIQAVTQGGIFDVLGAAVFNSTTDGARVGDGGLLSVRPVQSGSGPTIVVEPALWGSGNAGAGVNVQPGGRMSYKTGLLPNVTGARDRLVGDIKGSWSDGPVRDKGANAQVYAV